MIDAQSSRVLHVRLSEYIVADGDIEKPADGAVLRGLALRAIPLNASTLTTTEVIVGTVEWARHDEANNLFEAVVDAGSFRVLTQVEGRGPGWLIGSSVRFEGVLASVGPYEFEAFGLPDVRQEWFVASWRQGAVGADYELEIVPRG